MRRSRTASARGEEAGGRPGLELTTGIGAERRGIARMAGAARFVGLAAVGPQDHAAEADAAALNGRIAADRRATRAVEHGQERAFGEERRRRVWMVDRSRRIADAAVVRPGLDRDRALADRGQELLERQHRGGGAFEAEALEAGERQQGGVGRTVIELA